MNSGSVSGVSKDLGCEPAASMALEEEECVLNACTLFALRFAYTCCLPLVVLPSAPVVQIKSPARPLDQGAQQRVPERSQGPRTQAEHYYG